MESGYEDARQRPNARVFANQNQRYEVSRVGDLKSTVFRFSLWHEPGYEGSPCGIPRGFLIGCFCVFLRIPPQGKVKNPQGKVKN